MVLLYHKDGVLFCITAAGGYEVYIMDESNEFFSVNPELGNSLHWNNSSNVLCNYMKEQDYLNLILQNAAIIPRYVMEPLDYLDLKEIRKICFPMTCFCDIPFSKVSTHMSYYGEYGIGLDKQAVLNKYRVQPIHYINGNSPIADDFREAFKASAAEQFTGAASTLAAYLASSLMYMKPISGFVDNEDGGKDAYVYQDECEWRYIPSDNFPRELHLILKQTETTDKAKMKYSDVLKNHPECWLKFEWNDVRYIIVPDEAAVKHTIATIRTLEVDETEKDFLISKIEISRRFSDNM